jgi:hypothetical protein
MRHANERCVLAGMGPADFDLARSQAHAVLGYPQPRLRFPRCPFRPTRGADDGTECAEFATSRSQEPEVRSQRNAVASNRAF